MEKINKFRLSQKDLKNECSLEKYSFNTTEDLKPLKGIIGQERAVDAVNFGLKMKKKGYNIFVCGMSGTGRSSYTHSIVEKIARYKRNNKDFVYVYNFRMPNEPICLKFDSGVGKEFKKDVEDISQRLQEELPKEFEGKEYELKTRELMENYEKATNEVLTELNEYAFSKGFIFEISSKGMFSVPLKEDGKIMNDEEYDELTSEEMRNIKLRSSELNKDASNYLNKIKLLEIKLKKDIEVLDKKCANNVINKYIAYLTNKYGYDEKILSYFNDFENDMIENMEKFKKKEVADPLMNSIMPKNDDRFFQRYMVNLFIDSSNFKGANIVNETNPTYYNLNGAIEYKNEMGVLTTSFMELKPGAIHKANGGFLILDVRDVFAHPFAWEGLKRALKSGSVCIETLNKQYGYIVTSTLKPEPIEIDIKVILIGDNYLYNMLYAYDEDFKKLFKIMADFDTELNRSEENVIKIARFISAHCEKENLKHFERDAVEKIIEYSSRICENKEKLSAKFSQIVDVLFEADALSDVENKYVRLKDVYRAIEGKKNRNNKYEERLNELYKEGTLLIDVSGKKIGQINGLAVMGSGEYSFGKPARITASTYRGKSGIINVEREIKHSGSIHDKGVLILSGYLGNKYGRDKNISLTSSITFEQNYSGIDGDSASSTELYAILSSIGQLPIDQGIAVTGSINQMGEIQPIGGVNEKIEGFYDVCKIKGMTGKQGVMIPKQNVKNLMLREEIINAVKEEKFHIYAIDNVETGMMILSGLDIIEIDKKVNEALLEFESEKNNEDEKD